MAKKKAIGITDDITVDIENIVSALGDSSKDGAVNFWLPTGILLLDLAICNGMPGGKVAEFYGQSASGKSLIALSLIKSAQQYGGTGIWIDAEGGLSHSLMDLVGTSRDIGWTYKPAGSTEVTLNTIEKIIERSVDRETPTVIVLDSIAGLCPDSLCMGESEMTDPRVAGKNGYLLSWFFSRGTVSKMNGSNVYLILLNQVRNEINFFSRTPGKTWSTPGGHAVGFYSTVRLECSRIRIEEDANKKPQHSFHRVSVEKNKVGIPGREVTFPFLFRRDADITGIDDRTTCLDYLISRKVFGQSGAWYEFEEKKAHKKDWRQKMVEDKGFNDTIRKLVVKTYQEEYGLLGPNSKPITM